MSNHLKPLAVDGVTIPGIWVSHGGRFNAGFNRDGTLRITDRQTNLMRTVPSMDYADILIDAILSEVRV